MVIFTSGQLFFAHLDTDWKAVVVRWRGIDQWNDTLAVIRWVDTPPGLDSALPPMDPTCCC